MELKICNINKTYNGHIHAIKSLSMDIQSGILGLLGPNGAGKSTLMKIISTINKPDSGEVIFKNVDLVRNPQEMRKVLGYLPQDFGVYNNLSAIEFLKYIGNLKGVDSKKNKTRIYELLEILNLYEVRNRPLGSLSGGMRQRVGIAQALINDPKLLILDEPTVGLDPEERINFRNMISSMSNERIIILSTHIVSDLESVATKIAIIDKGSLINYSKPDKLLKVMQGKVWELYVPVDEYFKLKESLIVVNSITTTEGMKIRVISDAIIGYSATQVAPKLEDVYLYFTLINGSDQKNEKN
jgi:ABC-2 type transport system ATP-binding protein